MCMVCEHITEANKDIFVVFARTHQPGTAEEFMRVDYRFCPVCGCDLLKNRPMEEWERKENRS